ncbi:hypothetical protein PIIN_09621 [Serendipita indica DSM 11827]|uniref:Integrase catalytic domain-containing protein n=1 Tax=Serendipita indica (strain DSM 11827) TaxID=1109443 RepID=G4TWD7_SERID|nr:hypothetical protein PIIN_09621 [Serendipita indica DSM 11827]
MSNSKEPTSVPVLSKDNYPAWSRKMKAYFFLHDLYELVLGEDLKPTETDDQSKWIRRQRQAAAAITMSIDETNAIHIDDISDDPVAMWKKLASMHNNKTPGTRFNAMDSLFGVTKEDSEDLAELMTRINGLLQRVKQLRPTDYKITDLDDELAIMAMLRALPDNYRHLRSSLLCQTNITREVVEEAFRAEDNQRRHEQRSQATALRVATPNQNRTNGPPQHFRPKPSATDRTPGALCTFCGKKNHTEAQCFAKADASRRLKHEAARVADTSTGPATANATNASNPSLPSLARSDLNADTGATRTMMSDKRYFTTLCPSVRTIKLANGERIFSKGEGDIVFQPWIDGSFSSDLITFPNVLFAPDLESNLVSVLSMARNQGYEIRINSKQMEFYIDNKLRMTARIDANCVAYLDGRVLTSEKANAASTVKLDRSLWHRRLGHYHHEGVDTLIRQNLVHGLKLDSNAKPDPICAPCIAGKQTRAPHTTPATHATTPLDRVFIDLKGPINVESIPHRAKYWMAMVDDASNLVTLALLHSKDGALRAFREFHKLAENQTGQRLVHLRDDKGGEFSGKEFDQYCISAGITRERTVVATPEQNGRVERANRWIAEGTIAKLTEANLPSSFWGFAALATVHEFNRARVHNGKTPYEHWHGKAPSVDHLRVFGCLAYVFVPKSQRNALDSHTEKCIFVGYPSDRPGWVFWNPQTRKIIHSDSAAFDERVFPGTSLAKESIPNLSDYIQLPDLKEINISPSSIPPLNSHPPVHVAGRPVLAPIPPEPTPEPVPPPVPALARPKPTASQRLSREL